MTNEELSMLELLIETHIGLERQGPGSPEMTIKALSFIDVFNDNARKLNLGERVTGAVGSIENLSFAKDEFDLIWSEGAIDNIGFERGLTHWNTFLKRGGYVAVTCPSWLTDEYPAEIEKFWIDAGSGLDTIGNKSVEAYIDGNRYEVELYSKFKQLYGYVFHIGKKYRNGE